MKIINPHCSSKVGPVFRAPTLKDCLTLTGLMLGFKAWDRVRVGVRGLAAMSRVRVRSWLMYICNKV